MVSKYANLTYVEVADGVQPQRLFAIGDVHGCVDELNTLIDTIGYNYEQGDRIILLGDMVAKGPDSLGVVRRARELGAWCIRGNHDDKVVRIAGFQRERGPRADDYDIVPEGEVHDPLKMKKGHVRIASDLKDDVDAYEYLASCPMMLAIPSLQSLFVHAGLDPARPLDQQEPYFVMNMRSLQEDGSPAKHRSDGVQPWADAWEDMLADPAKHITPFRYIYYGHAAASRLQLRNHTFGIDSGCVYGGQLTALEVYSRKMYQVQCKKHAEKE